MGKSIGWILCLLVIVAVGWFASTMVSVDQTQEAELPNVSVTGGQMPKADVDAGSVDVGTQTRTIEVPSINVAPPVGGNAAPAN